MRVILVLIVFSINIMAQTGIDTTYEPSKEHPFGRLNPNAPTETKEFSFLIGKFECNDRIFNPADGKWYQFGAIWTGKYFLNGQAIQDNYWSPAFSASNIRVFDPRTKTWLVSFYRMPGFANSPSWKGKKEGDTMVMRKGNEKNGSRLKFSQISKDGFEWRGENLKDGKASLFWTSSCKRDEPE